MLAGLTGVQAYLDDVLVSEKAADNVARLKAGLQRFRGHGVKLRYDKCSFSQAFVTYLGHRIDRLGLHPTEKNVEAIVNAPSPGLFQAFTECVNNVIAVVSVAGKEHTVAVELPPGNSIRQSHTVPEGRRSACSF